jgi:hypothetical protein
MVTMSPDTAASEPRTPTDVLADVHRRLVHVHAALAERTDREVAEIMPWTLEELMALIREVGPYRDRRNSATTN